MNFELSSPEPEQISSENEEYLSNISDIPIITKQGKSLGNPTITPLQAESPDEDLDSKWSNNQETKKPTRPLSVKPMAKRSLQGQPVYEIRSNQPEHARQFQMFALLAHNELPSAEANATRLIKEHQERFNSSQAEPEEVEDFIGIVLAGCKCALV